MLEALKRAYTLCASDGTELRSLRAYLSYTSYSSREGEYGREHSFYDTALTDETDVEAGMLLFDGIHRYRIVSTNVGGSESILRLVRRVTFSHLASDGGTFDFIYRAVKERLGRDVLAGTDGISLAFSITAREAGVATVTGELIARAPTLGAAQTEALSVLEVLLALCEEADSPLLSVRRGAFRYEAEESGSGFITKEILNICIKEDADGR